MGGQTIPFAKRPLDVAIVVFFLVNLLFITYVVDLEQLVIPNAAHFTYPIWPPRPAVDLIHAYGRMYDHDLIARPVWWKMTIWIDNLFFGPFYVVAIYAYVKGKSWIRMPSVIYASMLLTNVIIILGEEYAGAYSLCGPHSLPARNSSAPARRRAACQLPRLLLSAPSSRPRIAPGCAAAARG